ncbi:MAG: ABC transporter ATP-binding protein [Bacteroidales bacterium]
MNVISADKLSKRYGSLKAVDSVGLSVKKGEIVGLLGANGAGKTTLIKMLCGMLRPDGGDGQVAGFSISSEGSSIRHHIGYMSQGVSLLENMSIPENIGFYGRVYGMDPCQINARWKELREILQLGDHRHKLAEELPSGVRQMLAFAIAVFHSPKILFLDEPTSGLDPMSRFEIWQQIYRTAYQGTTIMMSTHYLDEVWYCDRLILMENGRIRVEGSPEYFEKITGGKGLKELFFSQAT